MCSVKCKLHQLAQPSMPYAACCYVWGSGCPPAPPVPLPMNGQSSSPVVQSSGGGEKWTFLMFKCAHMWLLIHVDINIGMLCKHIWHKCVLLCTVHPCTRWQVSAMQTIPSLTCACIGCVHRHASLYCLYNRMCIYTYM